MDFAIFFITYIRNFINYRFVKFINNEQFFFKAVLLIISLPIVAGAIIILHTVDLYKNLENSRIQFAENPLWTLFLLPRTVCLQARVNNVEINHRDSGRTVWTLRQPTLIPWFPFHPLPQLPLRSPNLSNLLSSFPPFAISALAHTHTHAYTLSISSHRRQHVGRYGKHETPSIFVV